MKLHILQRVYWHLLCLQRQPTQARAIPLCIPNNFKWNPHTGNLEKTKERRQTLNVNDEALKELGKIKGVFLLFSITHPSHHSNRCHGRNYQHYHHHNYHNHHH